MLKTKFQNLKFDFWNPKLKLGVSTEWDNSFFAKNCWRNLFDQGSEVLNYLNIWSRLSKIKKWRNVWEQDQKVKRLWVQTGVKLLWVRQTMLFSKRKKNKSCVIKNVVKNDLSQMSTEYFIKLSIINIESKKKNWMFVFACHPICQKCTPTSEPPMI